MKLKDLLKIIGNFFSNLFKSVEKVYNKLEPEVKKAVEFGSGIIEIINRADGKTPTEILDKIEATYPDAISGKLEEALYAVADGFNLAVEEKNPLKAIEVIQAYLNGIEGGKWAKASAFAAKLIAAVFAPNAKSSIFELVTEWVYQHLIKDKV